MDGELQFCAARLAYEIKTGQKVDRIRDRIDSGVTP